MPIKSNTSNQSDKQTIYNESKEYGSVLTSPVHALNTKRTAVLPEKTCHNRATFSHFLSQAHTYAIREFVFLYCIGHNGVSAFEVGVSAVTGGDFAPLFICLVRDELNAERAQLQDPASVCVSSI